MESVTVLIGIVVTSATVMAVTAQVIRYLTWLHEARAVAREDAWQSEVKKELELLGNRIGRIEVSLAMTRR